MDIGELTLSALIAWRDRLRHAAVRRKGGGGPSPLASSARPTVLEQRRAFEPRLRPIARRNSRSAREIAASAASRSIASVGIGICGAWAQTAMPNGTRRASRRGGYGTRQATRRPCSSECRAVVVPRAARDFGAMPRSITRCRSSRFGASTATRNGPDSSSSGDFPICG